MPDKRAKVDPAPVGKGAPAKPKTTKPHVKSPAIGKNTPVVNAKPMNAPGKEIPEGLAKKYYSKSTFNTHDIMHSPVEKTLKMLDKILSGERLFTM